MGRWAGAGRQRWACKCGQMGTGRQAGTGRCRCRWACVGGVANMVAAKVALPLRREWGKIGKA